MDWLLGPRIAARGHFSRGSVILSSFVAIHMTLILYGIGSTGMGLGLVLIAWGSSAAFMAMLGAALVLGLTFKAIEGLRPNLVVYAFCGAAAGILHFLAGTTLHWLPDVLSLTFMVFGGFWMSTLVSGGNDAIIWRALFAEGAAGLAAGLVFAVAGTKTITSKSSQAVLE